MPKNKNNKKKIGKLDFIKTEQFYSLKIIIKKMDTG